VTQRISSDYNIALADLSLRATFVYGICKRGLDLVLSLVALVILSPVLLGVGVAIWIGSPGPVFYRAWRVGRDGRPFRMWKFRTMVVNADRIGGSSTADDDPRVTAIGRRLRKHKLDELPQLLNVLLGDMSLVGPRPQVLDEVAGYSAEERLLLDVPPGITDFASLVFRNEGEILRSERDPDLAYQHLIRPGKMRLGLLYVRRRSFAVDVAILWATILTIVRGVPPASVAGERLR
jgi:lipopolysaccharide/colanic/teichoic acid biosynthesis glycosyltransferase